MKRIFSALILVSLITVLLTGCGLREPRPEIKEGEFNFSVTYELHGEITTLTGVYVCEFEGIDWVLDGGYYRDWSGHIKDEAFEEFITLETATDGGIVELCLFFDPGHFMGDNYWNGDEPFTPQMSIRIYNEGLSFENDQELIAEVYGAKIISYEYDPPIENTFTPIFD